MELENKIKQKLRLRGFTEKQLLNNRGLIGATIDEVKLMLGKNLAIHYVSQQRELLIGYSKLILGDNYEAFEEFELKKIDEYLANL